MRQKRSPWTIAIVATLLLLASGIFPAILIGLIAGIFFVTAKHPTLKKIDPRLIGSIGGLFLYLVLWIPCLVQTATSVPDQIPGWNNQCGQTLVVITFFTMFIPALIGSALPFLDSHMEQFLVFSGLVEFLLVGFFLGILIRSFRKKRRSKQESGIT